MATTITGYTKNQTDSLRHVTRITGRMTTLPAQSRRTLILNFVSALVSSGVWAKLDGLYVLAAHQEQAGRINWVGSGAQDLVAVNSPTFVTNQGFQGDGATSYLDPGLPGNAADNYQQDNAFAAVWSLSNQGNNTWHDLAGGGGMYINSQTQSAVVAIRGNNSIAPSYTAAVTDSLGLTAFSRTAPTGFTAYRNGTVLGTATAASDALTSEPFYIGRHLTNYSGRKLALAAFGGGLTDAQVAAFYTAAHTYLLAVGAVAS